VKQFLLRFLKSKQLCFLFGHDTGVWEWRIDRFLYKQFDPTGIHWLHSHYRPAARWSLLAQHYPEKYLSQKCECKICGELIWEFYPKNLAGKVWGPEDDYAEIIAVMCIELQIGIPFVRY
jgi:hypothetical protein